MLSSPNKLPCAPQAWVLLRPACLPVPSSQSLAFDGGAACPDMGVARAAVFCHQGLDAAVRIQGSGYASRRKICEARGHFHLSRYCVRILAGAAVNVSRCLILQLLIQWGEKQAVSYIVCDTRHASTELRQGGREIHYI